MAKSKAVAPAEDGALINRLLAAFEQARKVDEDGNEYWLAREYGEILGYTWEGFVRVVERGKAALAAEGNDVDDHFRHVSKLIEVGKGGHRDIGDVELTRQAGYFVGINGDPRKKATIGAVQRYFVEQTRKQEIRVMLDAVGSDRDRLEACEKLAETEQELKSTVSSRLTRPDDHFDQIKRQGQRALFNKSPDQLKKEKGIPSDREIADFADPVVVKGMDFATALTARDVREDKTLQGVKKIGATHVKHNEGVRRVMVEGGSPPDTIPLVGDIRDVQARLEKQRTKLLKKQSEEE